MMVTERRGYGAAKKPATYTAVPRYGISPQLVPPVPTASERECFNQTIVSAPQVNASDKGDNE
jgi:hypothetical protein